ncbi:TIGR02269 family lipoprotein [Myxococcaceae bacterium JPH2]|nr:TIGR02269 family lipoprotein [Myxococcaceae bacterium JPH2]
MRLPLLVLLAVSLWNCASGPELREGSPLAVWREAEEPDSEDDDGDEDRCLVPVCATSGHCGLFDCRDVAPGRVVRALDMGGGAVMVAPGSGPARTWGSAQGLPGDSLPVLVFRMHSAPEEVLPSVRAREQAWAEYKTKRKEKHHIFPRAFWEHFIGRGINPHQWVMPIPLDIHRYIHRDGRGGPWNSDWNAFISHTDSNTSNDDYFRFAGALMTKYGLVGPMGTYWQAWDLSPQAAREK